MKAAFKDPRLMEQTSQESKMYWEFEVYRENPSGMLRRYEVGRNLFQLKSKVSEGHT